MRILKTSQFSVLVCFTAAYFLSYFFRSANAILAPDISQTMHLRASDLGFMTSLFYAAFALAQIPLGAGLDHWGPRWVTPALMLAGVAGSLMFAAAQSFPVLALGRGLIGLGMAGALMGGLKALSRWFPPERFATVSGVLTGLGSAGALVAATPLAWLNSLVGWRGVFVYGGLLTILVGLSIVTLTRNAPSGPTPARATGSLLGGYRDVFRDPRFWRIAPLIFFSNGALLAFQGLWAGPYLFDVYGLDKVAAGNLLLLLSLGVTVGFATSGWLSARLGLARVVAGGVALFIMFQGVLMLRPALPLVALAEFGLGLSGSFSIMLLVQPRQIFPFHLMGRATTATNLFGITGVFLLQWVMGLIIGAFPVSSAGHYPLAAYVLALALTAGGNLLTLLWYLPMLKSAQL